MSALLPLVRIDSLSSFGGEGWGEEAVFAVSIQHPASRIVPSNTDH